MSPSALHPVESRARELVLMLFGVTDPAARHNTAGVYLRPVYLDLMDRGQVPRDAASDHCAAILARAEQIEAMGRPTPARERHPGMAEYLDYGQTTIDQLMG